MGSHQLLVNGRQQIKCVLFICSSISFQPNYQLPKEEEHPTNRRVSFFCDDKDDHLLISLLQQYVFQSQIKRIVFVAIPHRFSPMIESVISNHNLGNCKNCVISTVGTREENVCRKSSTNDIFFLIR